MDLFFRGRVGCCIVLLPWKWKFQTKRFNRLQTLQAELDLDFRELAKHVTGMKCWAHCSVFVAAGTPDQVRNVANFFFKRNSNLFWFPCHNTETEIQLKSFTTCSLQFLFLFSNSVLSRFSLTTWNPFCSLDCLQAACAVTFSCRQPTGVFVPVCMCVTMFELCTRDRLFPHIKHSASLCLLVRLEKGWLLTDWTRARSVWIPQISS